MVTEETLKHYRNKITYAQNREDLLLESFFVDKNDGFYVDIGGFDPDHDSVTKLFYLRGWKGINIEPQPTQYKKFVKRRPRDINLNIAIGSKIGKLKLRIYKSGGLSTLSDKIKDQYVTSSEEQTASYKEVDVKVKRLSDVFKEHKVSSIDFMKIDVEGFEEEVIKGNDWEKYRPKVLCVESGFDPEDTRKLLENLDYRCVFNDGLNDYYVDARRNDTKSLAYIDHMLIRRGGGVRVEDYQNIKTLFDRNKKLDNDLEKERAHVRQLNERADYLAGLLNDPRILLRKSLKLYFRRVGNIGRRLHG